MFVKRWRGLVLVFLVACVAPPDEAIASADLFKPYPTAQQAIAAQAGSRVGQRFPDLAFKRPDGMASKLSDYRGKIVFLHFWGAWCPPCVKELPELVAMHGRIGKDDRIQFIFLQFSESYDTSINFLKRRKWDSIPVFDSLNPGRGVREFPLASGEKMFARNYDVNLYPASFILDRHGIVIGGYQGPNWRWEKWEVAIRDAMDNAPRID